MQCDGILPEQFTVYVITVCLLSIMMNNCQFGGYPVKHTSGKQFGNLANETGYDFFFNLYILPKISVSFPSSPPDMLPFNLSNIGILLPFFHAIFFPTAMILSSPLHNLIFFPNRLDKGECARFPFSGRGGVQGRIFQDILLIFSPKVQIWDEANYSKKKIENCFARKKCAFLCIITLFFSDGWLWVSFLGIFFYGEFIPIIKNAIERKKCARTEALLGTYAHFL